jgi:hypothetical protein
MTSKENDDMYHQYAIKKVPEEQELMHCCYCNDSDGDDANSQ